MWRISLRTEAAIRHKLKQAVYRHLQRELRQALRRRPHTCTFNRNLTVQPGVQVGVCLTKRFRYRVCDANVRDVDGIDGVGWAKICPEWKPPETKEQIKERLTTHIQDLLGDEDRGPLAAAYPDLAALVWAMDPSGKNTNRDEADNPLAWLWEGEGEEEGELGESQET